MPRTCSSSSVCSRLNHVLTTLCMSGSSLSVADSPDLGDCLPIRKQILPTTELQVANDDDAPPSWSWPSDEGEEKEGTDDNYYEHQDNHSEDARNIESHADTEQDQLLLYYAELRARVEAQFEAFYQLQVPRYLNRIRILQEITRELDQYVTLPGLCQHGGGKRGVVRAKESTVAVLKNIKIASEKNIVLCPVCQDEVNVGECAKESPCGHCYHENCIMTWLAYRNTCPVCRFELPT
ncbi:hypothetical protein AgCh_006921 [Apium graveolens]